MTMTEQPTETTKPAKKVAKKRGRRAQPTPSAPRDDYAGISTVNCPSACNAARCVISDRGICGHPYKGGLQASLQTPEAIRRLNAAKRVIGKRKLDLAADS
jgi:hypothetical protein